MLSTVEVKPPLPWQDLLRVGELALLDLRQNNLPQAVRCAGRSHVMRSENETQEFVR
jgi:hypothetical protein